MARRKAKQQNKIRPCLCMVTTVGQLSLLDKNPFYWWYGLAFRLGIVDLFSLNRPGPHLIVHLFSINNHKLFFLKTEEIPDFLHTFCGTEQPTSAGRHTATESNNPPPHPLGSLLSLT